MSNWALFGLLALAVYLGGAAVCLLMGGRRNWRMALVWPIFVCAFFLVWGKD